MNTLAPERMYGWMNGQLSVARYYGGCTYRGYRYVIAYDEEEKPLVREDVLKRETKERAAEKKAAASSVAALQSSLLD